VINLFCGLFNFSWVFGLGFRIYGYRYLEVLPGRCGGRVTIRGTRITVDDILESLANGWSVDEICVEFNISREAVLEALKYASELLRKTEVLVIEGNGF